MSNFNSNITEKPVDKLKNIKLIHKLRTDTYDGKLTWEILYRDVNVTTFKYVYKITDNKELTFSVRCEDRSVDKDGNVLRAILRTKNLKPPISDKVSSIKTITLLEYPSLIQLIKILKDTYLEKPPILTNKSTTLKHDNFKDYKEHSIITVKDIINNLPDSRYKVEKFGELYQIIDDMYDSDNVDDINKLLFVAYKISNNVI